MGIITSEKIKSSVFGLLVGDALGVPVEFSSRKELDANPVTDMREYGTHDMPKGSWSDDGSMTLCLLESLIDGLDYSDIASKFLSWVENGYMTPFGEMFDIGRTTFQAVRNYAEGTPPLKCGLADVSSNGNGSLMRIIPLAFFTFIMPLEQRFETIHNISRLTHAHPLSLIGCGIYITYAIELIKSSDKNAAYRSAINICTRYYSSVFPEHLKVYGRVLNGSLTSLERNEIKSSGYVADTLEAAIWCLLTTDSFNDCVLKAVNLGDDTDTVAAVAGGLAGLLYGYEEINSDWVSYIVRRSYIEDLCNSFAKSLNVQ